MARHRFFTLSPEVLCAIGYDGRFQRVNPAFTEAFGHDDRELRRICFIELATDEDQHVAKEELEHLVAGSVTREFEIRCRCADGREKWLTWTAKSYPKEKVIYAAARDTTQQKTAEQQLKKYNRRLRELSAASQAATQAKSELLANVSHELRTPMSAILMIADILQKNVANPENYEAVGIIKRNGEYLLTLINQLLDISKVEAGKLTVESIRCSPLAILAEVESLVRLRAEEKCLRFEVSTAGPIPKTVQTDPTRLREILINLIDNAIKFTEFGGVNVSVSLHAERSQLQFDVTDTGIGMNATQIETLFDPFTQGDSSTTRKFGGTGLGLTISLQLAKMLGGDIAVTSAPGEGSTFSLFIDTGALAGVRFVTAAEPQEAVTSPTISVSSPPRLACRVLLAEDYLDIQRPVTYVLERAGARVTVADNGQKAIDLALASQHSEDPFDMVLMDMQMPVVDGYTATKQLRHQGYDGPIIAMTAHAMDSDRQKCLEAGCDDYVAKPLEMAKLIGLIHRHTQRTPVRN